MCERATRNGRMFEEEKDLRKYFIKHGFNVEDEKDYGFSVYRKDEDAPCALYLIKTELYAFLKDNSRFETYKGITSRRNDPDAVVVVGNVIHIVEMKYQSEGHDTQYALLPYCDYKKQQYQKLVVGTNYEIRFHYLLSESMNTPKNRDIFQYIHDVGCDYYFEEIPLDVFGL